MDAPEELRQAITDAINAPASSYHGQADAVLAVPAIADALARDAEARLIMERRRINHRHDADALAVYNLAALYPETEKGCPDSSLVEWVAAMLRDPETGE